MRPLDALMQRLGYVSLKRFGLELTAGGRVVSHRTALVDDDLIVGWEDNDLDAMELSRWFPPLRRALSAGAGNDWSAHDASIFESALAAPDLDDRAIAAARDEVIHLEAIDLVEDFVTELGEDDDWDWQVAFARAKAPPPSLHVLRRADTEPEDLDARRDDLVEAIEAIDTGDIVATHLESPLASGSIAPIVRRSPSDIAMIVDEWYRAFESRPPIPDPLDDAITEPTVRPIEVYEEYVAGVRPLRVVVPRQARPQTIIPIPPLQPDDRVHTAIPIPPLPPIPEPERLQPIVRASRTTMPSIPPPLAIPKPRDDEPTGRRLAQGTADPDRVVAIPPPKRVSIPRIVKSVGAESRSIPAR